MNEHDPHRINTVKQPDQPTEPPVLSKLYNYLSISKITEVSDAGPNYLVPSGLIYNEASKKLFDYLKNKGIKFYLDTDKKSEEGYSNKDGRFIFYDSKLHVVIQKICKSLTT